MLGSWVERTQMEQQKTRSYSVIALRDTERGGTLLYLS